MFEKLASTCSASLSLSSPGSDAAWTSMLLLGPILSFLYSVSVWFFLCIWRECPWANKEHMWCMSIRLALALCSYGLRSSVSCASAGVAGSAVVSVSVLCGWLCWRTRQNEILGPVPLWVSMEGKVVLITGANAGIGRETARQLLQRGATVVMACRSESRAKEAMADISPSPTPKLIFLKLDLSSLQSVTQAAQQFQKLNLPLHVLINNAGVMMGTRTTVPSPDNQQFELMMAANHLGHFLLTNLLMPKLQQTAAAEPQQHATVLTITSSTYHLAKQIDLQDLMADGTNRQYSLFGQYAMTKLANILMCRHIAQTTHNIRSYSIHPGLVRTEVTKNMPLLLRKLNDIFAFFVAIHQKTPEAGAYTSVYCATANLDPNIVPNGTYFVNSRPQQLNQYAMDSQAAAKLWDLSEELVGLKNDCVDKDTSSKKD